VQINTQREIQRLKEKLPESNARFKKMNALMPIKNVIVMLPSESGFVLKALKT